ncbi:MAG: hypothetical protein ACREQ5_15005, partial [Candidatus Dormibacteria bacterium]
MVAINPLYQGDEDSLCGLYAIINSLRLLWPGTLTDKQISDLFRSIAGSLDRWPSILWDGTHYLDMVNMLTVAQAILGAKNFRFTWTRPFKNHSID